MKVLLIEHPGAGGGVSSAKQLAGAIEETGWKVRRLDRKKATAKAIAKAEPDLVAVAGGDGSVADILARLPDRTVPVAILPTGTANNIARSLGIVAEPESLIAAWDLKRRLRFDIGNAHCPWGCRSFAEGVGFGAFADSLRLAPDVDGAQKLRAGRDALRRALKDSAPLPLEIDIDGEALPGDLLLAEVMNVRLTGPRLPIACEADPGDGRLDVAHLRAADRARMRDWLERDEGGMPTAARTGREVTIRGGGTMMRIDDECCWLEPKSEVMLRIEGEPVQILAPPETPALAG
jgi:diacylglycerol kinase family enzyme